ncbi:MAG: DUF5749 family beta-barrel protein [Candidatus Thermoplasmatota archaeon]|nr:DUF5749 family beta-barrel protein [Candidatus Thermoplasmatota archaeon]
MARSKKGSPDLKDLDIEGFMDDHLSLHVKDRNGESRGESIGFDGNYIILKKKDEYLKIPLSSIEKKEDHLKIKKKVNWKNAKKEGERWRKKELNPL